MAGLRIAQWLLSALILASAIVLLGMGIVIIIFSVAAMLQFNKLTLHSAAALLKVDNELTHRNLGEVFRVLFTVGYGTVNIATLAVCAASGRRRAHSAVAAAGSGLAAFLYLSLLLSFIRPRIDTVGKLLDDALEKYYKAFQLTGDEKFLSQIQLQNGCCGLEKGPADFEDWKRPVPSSCCGLFTGNCTLAKSRRTPCRKAIKNLSGSDGLFDCGYISWLLGVACGVMGGLLVLLTLGGGSDGFEALLRARAKERQESGGDESKTMKKKKKKTKDADLSQQALLTKRDQEIRAALLTSVTASADATPAASAAPSTAAATPAERGQALPQPKASVAQLPAEATAGGTGGARRESRFQVQNLLQKDIRQRGGGTGPQLDNIQQFLQRRMSVGGMRGQLQEKLIRELEKERQRLAAAAPTGHVGHGGGGGGSGAVPKQMVDANALEEKLAREKKNEQQRLAAVQGSRNEALEEKLDREKKNEQQRLAAVQGSRDEALEGKLQREADIDARRAEAIAKKAKR